jgi:hypothetical protein
MGIAAWLRERLWRAEQPWCAELLALRKLARTAEQIFDLAVATEYCDPDRSNALALYVQAWRGGHAPARDRARDLAEVLRAHVTLGELALAKGDLVAAGAAYLDAGLFELAVEPLAKFIEARPADANPSSEHLRLERGRGAAARIRARRESRCRTRGR